MAQYLCNYSDIETNRKARPLHALSRQDEGYPAHGSIPVQGRGLSPQDLMGTDGSAPHKVRPSWSHLAQSCQALTTGSKSSRRSQPDFKLHFPRLEGRPFGLQGFTLNGASSVEQGHERVKQQALQTRGVRRMGSGKKNARRRTSEVRSEMG